MARIYGLSYRGKVAVKDTVETVRGQSRLTPAPQRRARGKRGSGGGSRTSEVVGELALTVEPIGAVEAVDFESLDDDIKEALDPEGIFDQVTDLRIWKMGAGLAHQHKIILVNEGSGSDPDYGYYIVPVFEPLDSSAGSDEEPIPRITIALNMSQEMDIDHFIQMKTVGFPQIGPQSGFSGGSSGEPGFLRMAPEGRPYEEMDGPVRMEAGFGEGSGDFGAASSYDQQSAYSRTVDMVSGVVDVYSCAPVPNLTGSS